MLETACQLLNCRFGIYESHFNPAVRRLRLSAPLQLQYLLLRCRPHTFIFFFIIDIPLNLVNT